MITREEIFKRVRQMNFHLAELPWGEGIMFRKYSISDYGSVLVNDMIVYNPNFGVRFKDFKTNKIDPIWYVCNEDIENRFRQFECDYKKNLVRIRMEKINNDFV